MAASTPHESQTALLGHEAHPHRLTEEEHRWAVALRQKLDLEGIPQPETDFLLVSGSCCGCMLQTLTWSARPLFPCTRGTWYIPLPVVSYRNILSLACSNW